MDTAAETPVELTPEERAIDLAIVEVLDRYGEDKVEHWDVRCDASPEFVELRVILTDGAVATWQARADGQHALLSEQSADEIEAAVDAGRAVVRVELDEQALAREGGDFVNAAVGDAFERHPGDSVEVVDIDGESVDEQGRTIGIEVTVADTDADDDTATTYVYTLKQ